MSMRVRMLVGGVLVGSMALGAAYADETNLVEKKAELALPTPAVVEVVPASAATAEVVKTSGAPAEVKAPEKGAYVKPPSAKAMVESKNGNVVVWYDPTKWMVGSGGDGEAAEFEFTHKKGDGTALLISERIEIPMSKVKDVVLGNAGEGAKVVFEDKRVVNGMPVVCLKMTARPEDIPFSYYGYYYAGKAGFVQLVTFSTDNLFDEYAPDFKELLNGMEIKEKASSSTPKMDL